MPTAGSRRGGPVRTVQYLLPHFPGDLFPQPCEAATDERAGCGGAVCAVDNDRRYAACARSAVSAGSLRLLTVIPCVSSDSPQLSDDVLHCLPGFFPPAAELSIIDAFRVDVGLEAVAQTLVGTAKQTKGHRCRGSPCSHQPPEIKIPISQSVSYQCLTEKSRPNTLERNVLLERPHALNAEQMLLWRHKARPPIQPA